MNDEQFFNLMCAIGFGFGSLFWPFLWWLLLRCK